MNNTVILAAALAVFLAACGSTPEPSVATPGGPAATSKSSPATGGKRAGGGYYKDDGPADDIPANLEQVPDAVPRWEPLHKPALRPYEVFGTRYVPHTSVRPYKAQGIASWYGKKFHGQKTSIGETYDMFAMTAAHPTLALPSYVRVTNVGNGKSVVVRVNDRGPFHADRIIDLSYAAAHRIGVAQKGSGEVEVEALLPGDPVSVAAAPLPPVTLVPMPSAATPPEAAAQVPVAPLAGGFVVQLGAFASNGNAQNFIAHLANQLAPLGVEAKVRQAGGLFRVFVGPYVSRDEARRIGDRLRDGLGLASTVASH